MRGRMSLKIGPSSSSEYSRPLKLFCFLISCRAVKALTIQMADRETAVAKRNVDIIRLWGSFGLEVVLPNVLLKFGSCISTSAMTISSWAFAVAQAQTIRLVVL